MGPHLLAGELMKEKSGETNERKLNTETSYLVPRVTNPTRADCLAKPKVAQNSLPAESYYYWLKIDVISLYCICWNLY